MCKTYNIGKFYKSYQDLIKDKSIDTGLICSQQVFIQNKSYLLRNIKDIFCEKPVDLSLEKTIEVLNIINKNKVKFMIGFNRRFIQISLK